MLDSLTCLGMENIAYSENIIEVSYILETTAWQQPAEGILNAVKYIQEHGIPKGKDCRIVILYNNIPQLTLFYNHLGRNYSPAFTSLQQEWDITYDTGNEWKNFRRLSRHNSSCFKIDLVVYPEVALKNVVVTQIYQVLLNLSPAIEISFWKGMKIVGQVVFPIYNDGYTTSDSKIHPRVLAFSQTFRLPRRTFGRVSAGMFYSDRYGGDLSIRHFLRNERLSVDGRISYTASGYWERFLFHYNNYFRLTWSVGGSFYWPLYNIQLSGHIEQYLLQEKGIRVDLIRHFRHCSIGFYAMKAEGARKNAGFRFQIALPPYRHKRSGVFRINTAAQMGMAYNAGNERYYYKTFRVLPEDNIMKDNGFNPFFILNSN